MHVATDNDVAHAAVYETSVAVAHAADSELFSIYYLPLITSAQMLHRHGLSPRSAMS
jgi:hypothetical protein